MPGNKIICLSKKRLAYEIMCLDKENMPNEWHRKTGRKRVQEINNMTKKLLKDLDNNPAKVATDKLTSSVVSNDGEDDNVSRRAMKRHKTGTKLLAILSGICTIQQTCNLKL